MSQHFPLFKMFFCMCSDVVYVCHCLPPHAPIVSGMQCPTTTLLRRCYLPVKCVYIPKDISVLFTFGSVRDRPRCPH